MCEYIRLLNIKILCIGITLGGQALGHSLGARLGTVWQGSLLRTIVVYWFHSQET